jgi:hypothetical protein
MVSYYLCNSTQSVYNWGLSEKMFNRDYDYISEWSWILNDIYTLQKNSITNNPYGLFNLTYIDQNDYANVHRSGWQYVYDNIKYLHNTNADMLLDLYLDKTFGWNSSINELLGIIPYTKSWIGFIHHTFDTSFSNNNVYTIINNPAFLSSLPFCKSLFVLSKHLKSTLQFELSKKNIDIDIHVIYHPAEFVSSKFNFNKFLLNEKRGVVNIGGWLRNIYNYYSINIPSRISHNYFFFRTKSLTFYKKSIKGKNMNNYYPDPDFLTNLRELLSDSKLTKNTLQNCSVNCSTNCSVNCSANCSVNCSANCSVNCSVNCSANCSANCSSNCSAISNNWYNHMYRDIVTKIRSVDIIERLENDEYDKLLTDNIVFLNLVDASAVNTVLECIARNTPIIINKIPAIVEVLGEDYPLYYDDCQNFINISHQVESLLKDTNSIKKAHRYLKKLNKEKFTITFFVSEFVKILQSIHVTSS